MSSTLTFLAIVTFIVACNKSNNADTDTLAPEDIAAVSNMKSNLASMETATVDKLRARINDIHSNKNLLGKAQNREAIEDVQKFL